MSSQMFWLLSYVSLGVALSLGNRATSIHGSSSSSSSSSSASSVASSLSSSSTTSYHQQQQQAATSGLRTRQEGRFGKNEASIRPVYGEMSSPLILELDNPPAYRYEISDFDEQETDFRRSLNEDDENEAAAEGANNDYYYRYNNIYMNNNNNNINNINNNNNNNNKNTNKNNRNSKEERGRTGSNTRESAFLDEFAMAVLDSLDPRDRRLLISGRRLSNPRDEGTRRMADIYRARRRLLRSRNGLTINSMRNNGNNENDLGRKTSRSRPIRIYDRVRTLDGTDNRNDDDEFVIPEQKYTSADWSNDEITRIPDEPGATKIRREDNEDREQDHWNLADKMNVKRNDGSRGRIPSGSRNAPQWTGNPQPRTPNPPGGANVASQLLLRSARGNRQYDVPQIECPASEDGMERFACPTPDRMGRYRCIDDHVLCDGFIDCPTAEDEDRQACMFYKTTKAHLDILADALLRWARGR